MDTHGKQEFEIDLVVDRRTAVAGGVVLLALRDRWGRELPEWQPGAHVDLLLEPGLVRQYSLCGDPSDRSRWQLGILLERDGRGGSRHVHEHLAEGSLVRARGPRNHFPVLPSKRYLFIAGGIGITPIVPMLAAVESAGAQWQLVYGGRTRSSMAFREELWARYGDKVAIRPQDETGLLDLDRLLGAPAPDILVYCCGPEPLLQAVEERCAAWPRGSLHVERFAPKAMGEPVLQETFEIELKRSGLRLVVPSEKSILEVLTDARVQVLSSCTEGTCGTCETMVIEGIPEHRDSVLTEEERSVGDAMMICVSRSLTPTLVLDV
jgi:ferredoxin-NADP reductase